MKILFNGAEVFSKHTAGNPDLNDDIDLSGQLNEGNNYLWILGANYGGPAHFRLKITLAGTQIGNFDDTSGGNGIIFTKGFDIKATP